MSKPIPVVDIFAGPGGLGEGFSAFGAIEGNPRFKIGLSIEMDKYAHKTLELRSFYRKFAHGKAPEEYYALLRGEITRGELFSMPAFESQVNQTRAEAMLAELGNDDQYPPAKIDACIERARGDARHWVLVGGPPCQAYSVVGRSRRRGIKGYSPEKDGRHFLYLEYLRIIAAHQPSVFVMENVKGLLSARVQEQQIFQNIRRDLSRPGDAMKMPKGMNNRRYRLFSLARHGLYTEGDSDPRDFIIECERYGVPQARHRVIILGIREDLQIEKPETLQKQPSLISVEKVLYGLPRVRAGLSREEDSKDAWLKRIKDAIGNCWIDACREDCRRVHDLVQSTVAGLTVPKRGRGREFLPGKVRIRHMPEWFLDPRLGGVCNHSTRGHMAEDLHRYLFAACYAKVNDESPTLRDFPHDLLPLHRNVEDGVSKQHFADRFRVQIATKPSRTVVSHIQKDGHYYIHYDPTQCRSLTVREAARLQTFPDNYFFCGPRTAQYGQVGNAVPPLLAEQIAGIVFGILAKVGAVE